MALAPTGLEIEKDFSDPAFDLFRSKIRDAPRWRRDEFRRKLQELVWSGTGEEGNIPTAGILAMSPSGMAWDRGDCLAYAWQGCTNCHGAGSLFCVNKHGRKVCSCVFRRCFRECWAKREQLKVIQDRSKTGTSKSYGGTMFGRKAEEYVADIELVAERTISGMREAEILRKLHHHRNILGGDVKWLGAKLDLNKGQIFHLTYKLEAELGRVFHELEPYALHPTSVYFGEYVHQIRTQLDAEKFAIRKRRLQMMVMAAW